MSFPITTTEGAWVHARRSHFEAVKRFLLPRESTCVTVTEAMPGAKGPGRKNGRFTVFTNRGTVSGCVFHTANGFVFPVFPEDGLPEPGSLVRKLRGPSQRLFCVMGLRRDVESLKQLFFDDPIEEIHYYHMSRTCGSPLDHQPLPESMTVRKAGPADAEVLYPIQRDYEIEEVVLAADRFDPAGCMYQLKTSLKNQLVYLIEHRGRPIAKAQTNARGFYWDQIGGVFTERSQRGRGIGRAVMYKLLRDVECARRNTSLFVKQHNESALRMYRRLGYSTRDEFTIAYYRPV